MFGFVIVIALAASFSPIGLLAAPLAAWPTWMTVLLLHQRAFWENDVSQGDIARSCVRYAIVNALAAGMVVGVTIVRRQQPNERSRTTARPPAAHRSK
jgi:hypothetical protein